MKNLIVISLVILANQLTAQYDSKALAVLDAMSSKMEKMESYKVELNERLINEVAGIDEEIPKKNISIKGLKFVLELPEHNQILFYNGEILHRFLPQDNEVYVVEDFDPEVEFESLGIRPDQMYSVYKKGYKYRMLETKSNGDRLIELQPENRDSDFISMIMTVDAKNIISQIVVNTKELNKHIYDIKVIEAAIPDTFFSFDFKSNPNVDIIE